VAVCPGRCRSNRRSTGSWSSAPCPVGKTAPFARSRPDVKVDPPSMEDNGTGVAPPGSRAARHFFPCVFPNNREFPSRELDVGYRIHRRHATLPVNVVRENCV
jgi:hypothetical protein